LPGEDTDVALSLRNQAENNPQSGLLVPPTFWYEVTNVLWVATRRERLSSQNAMKALELLMCFDFIVWPTDPINCLTLSISYDLAVYDTAYLDIAIERQAKLWTMDKALKKVAEELGIGVLP
jgi:predicted nucleic acid-binding protein